jgi:type VI secretion system protein ImpH
MAEAPSQRVPTVIGDILSDPRRFSYSQVLRMLRRWAGATTNESWLKVQRERIRIRPPLSMSFAPTDVDAVSIELAREGDPCPFAKVLITASFLGLYGPSSPLPAFYTERLLDEREQDSSVVRDFLDIFQTGLFLLHDKLQSTLQPLRRGIAESDAAVRHVLMSLASFGAPACCSRLPDENGFLRYAGLFSQSVRSAAGLRAMLSDAAHCPSATVHCNVKRNAAVPQTQWCLLGTQACSLGEDAVLGETIPCHEGKIRLAFTGLEADALERLLPETALARFLHELVRNYCREPMEYDALLELLPGEAQPACLGGDGQGRFSRLGRDSWLSHGGAGTDRMAARVQAYFPGGFDAAGGAA